MTFTPAEIAELRAATPGCAHVTHFNHAGASLMPQVVVDATIGHLELEATRGGYEAADIAEARLEAVYDSVATLINANGNEIALVENATRAWDMAFYAIPFRPGDRILTSAAEYASNVISFLQVARQGVSIEVIPNDEFGQVSVSALESMMDDHVRVIAVSHMPTNGGLVQPAAAIGRIARAGGALYLLDACQTAGQMPLDVREIQCDVLSATSRKYLRGPRGVGFLYVRNDLISQLEPPMLDLHAARWVAPDRYEMRGDARRFENWETYTAGRLGFGAAVDYALDLGLDRIWATVEANAATLRAALTEIPGISVHDQGETKGGIVTFAHERAPADDLVTVLAARRINTVSSSVFSTRFDMEARGLTKLVRASVHYLTTAEEIDRLTTAVREIAC